MRIVVTMLSCLELAQSGQPSLLQWQRSEEPQRYFVKAASRSVAKALRTSNHNAEICSRKDSPVL